MVIINTIIYAQSLQIQATRMRKKTRCIHQQVAVSTLPTTTILLPTTKPRYLSKQHRKDPVRLGILYRRTPSRMGFLVYRESRQEGQGKAPYSLGNMGRVLFRTRGSFRRPKRRVKRTHKVGEFNDEDRTDSHRILSRI